MLEVQKGGEYTSSLAPGPLHRWSAGLPGALRVGMGSMQVASGFDGGEDGATLAEQPHKKSFF